MKDNIPIPSKPPIRPALSFSGKLPDDWSPEQQQRLQWAVEEIARRSNIRPPGYRTMQAIQAIRNRDGRDLEGRYDLRFSHYFSVTLSPLRSILQLIKSFLNKDSIVASLE
jgi:hypothetical protein